jgi:hypothetical protein
LAQYVLIDRCYVQEVETEWTQVVGELLTNPSSVEWRNACKIVERPIAVLIN